MQRAASSHTWQLSLDLPPGISTERLPGPLRDLLVILVHAYELHDASASPAPRRRRQQLLVGLEYPDLWAESDTLRDLSLILEGFFGTPVELELAAAESPAHVALNIITRPRQDARGLEASPLVVAFSPDLDSIAAITQHLAHDGRDLVAVALDLLGSRRPAAEKLLGRLLGEDRFHLCTLAVKPPDQFSLASSADRLRDGWHLLRVVAAAAVALALDLSEARFFENGISNLKLPITLSTLASRFSHSVDTETLDALNRLLLRITGTPFRLHNPFIAKTPAEVVESMLSFTAAGTITDIEELCSLVENENEPERGMDQRISALGGLLGAPSLPRNDARALAPELTMPMNENVADAYVRAIRELPALPDHELLSRIAHGGIAQANGDSGGGRLVVDLFRRHTDDVRRVLAQVTSCYAQHIVAGTLAPDCLIIRAAMPEQTQPSEAPRQPTFRKRTDRWEIWFEQGEPLYLNQAKGLDYIYLLLQQPGHVYTATDLRAHVAGHYSVPSGAIGVTADKKAIRSYRMQINDLRTELDKVTEQNDIGRKQRIQEEIEAIQAHLGACLNLAGRPRETNDTERARKAVSIAIRRSLQRLRDVHPALARHLDAALHVGLHLCYRPDPPVSWIT